MTSGIPSTSSITFTVFLNMLFPGVAYSSEVPEGFQHHIFADILLRRIHQSPLFPREVNTNIIVGHCIHSAAATLAWTPQTAEPTVQHMGQLLSCLLSSLTQCDTGTYLWLEINTWNTIHYRNIHTEQVHSTIQTHRDKHSDTQHTKYWAQIQHTQCTGFPNQSW